MSRKVIFLDTNGWIAILNASDSLHVEADAMWRKLVRDSNSFVFTDWVMQDQGIRDAFTNDRHFEQAGFDCLLPLP
jgi:predicted nucleic acid-binding protein